MLPLLPTASARPMPLLRRLQPRQLLRQLSQLTRVL